MYLVFGWIALKFGDEIFFVKQIWKVFLYRLDLNEKIVNSHNAQKSFLRYFGEALDAAVMEDYPDSFLRVLFAKLQAPNFHRGVKEERIASVAIIAGSIGAEFGKFVCLEASRLGLLVK